MLRHLGHDAASRLRHLYDRHLQSQYSDRKIYWENRSFSRSQYKTIAVVGRNPGTPGEIRCTSCPFTATPTSSCPLDPLPCDPILDPEVPMEKRLADLRKWYEVGMSQELWWVVGGGFYPLLFQHLLRPPIRVWGFLLHGWDTFKPGQSFKPQSPNSF